MSVETWTKITRFWAPRPLQTASAEVGFDSIKRDGTLAVLRVRESAQEPRQLAELELTAAQLIELRTAVLDLRIELVASREQYVRPSTIFLQMRQYFDHQLADRPAEIQGQILDQFIELRIYHARTGNLMRVLVFTFDEAQAFADDIGAWQDKQEVLSREGSSRG